jgi:hypothetical protein
MSGFEQAFLILERLKVAELRRMLLPKPAGQPEEFGDLGKGRMSTLSSP